MSDDRATILTLVAEAVKAGCRFVRACAELGLDPRTVQRWKQRPDGADKRRGPSTPPKQKLSDEERQHVLATVNTSEFRNLPVSQIVPQLADRGVYIASESTIRRILVAEGQSAHRGAAKPRTVQRPEEMLATGPNQVWSWDITYLPSPVRGRFFYLYMFVDVWSRRIMKAVVHTEESTEFAASLLLEAAREHGIEPNLLTLHSDNGGPMKGATMLATMQALGIVPSFSRPSVSDDNPFSEALFRTLKYVPSYPRKPFASVDAAWRWVEEFVNWYNNVHRHSAIGFVTPEQRHRGRDIDVLLARRDVYEAARKRRPDRWSRGTRNWNAPAAVALNPRVLRKKARAGGALRCGAHLQPSMAPQNAVPKIATLPRRQIETTSEMTAA